MRFVNRLLGISVAGRDFRFFALLEERGRIRKSDALVRVVGRCAWTPFIQIRRLSVGQGDGCMDVVRSSDNDYRNKSGFFLLLAREIIVIFGPGLLVFGTWRHSPTKYSCLPPPENPRETSFD